MADKNILNILVVDDEAVVRDMLKRFLDLLPVRSVIASGGREALELAGKDSFDLIFLDIRMPGMNGLEVFMDIRKILPGVSFVFMTGYGSAEEELLVKIKDTNIQCLRKPFEDLNLLKDIIAKASSRVVFPREPKEKRSSVRLDMALEVEYTLDGRKKKAMSRNISLGGIKLLMDEAIPVGSRLDLSLRNNPAAKACLVKAEVVWVKASIENQGYFDAGLKFNEININELSGLITKGDDKMRDTNRGFTLIELMLVVIIIGALAAMVMPRLAGRGEQARVTAAKADIMTNISTALKLYELDNGAYPTSEEGLEALLSKPSSANGWNGPYLERRPIDPWNREYKYKSPGDHRPADYDLYSLGKDGQEASADDVKNWD